MQLGHLDASHNMSTHLNMGSNLNSVSNSHIKISNLMDHLGTIKPLWATRTLQFNTENSRRWLHRSVCSKTSSQIRPISNHHRVTSSTNKGSEMLKKDL